MGQWDCIRCIPQNSCCNEGTTRQACHSDNSCREVLDINFERRFRFGFETCLLSILAGAYKTRLPRLSASIFHRTGQSNRSLTLSTDPVSLSPVAYPFNQHSKVSFRPSTFHISKMCTDTQTTFTCNHRSIRTTRTCAYRTGYQNHLHESHRMRSAVDCPFYEVARKPASDVCRDCYGRERRSGTGGGRSGERGKRRAGRKRKQEPEVTCCVIQ